MEFFDTDLIEGRKKVEVSDDNIEEVFESKKAGGKLAVLEFLNTLQTSSRHFSYILKGCKYAIREVFQEYFKVFLQWFPYSNPDEALDEVSFEVLLVRIIPWVNQIALKVSSSLDQDDNPEARELEKYNSRICTCIDVVADQRLPHASINKIVKNVLKNPNPLIQIAGCQAVKHFYLAVEDKLILELHSIFEVLITNNSIGSSKDLKRYSLECMMAIYRVFGENVMSFLENLNSPEKLEAIKAGAALLELKVPEKPAKKQASQRNAAKALQQPGSNQLTLSAHNSTKSLRPPVSKKEKEGTREAPDAEDSQQELNNAIDFDEGIDQPASDLLASYDDKWVKRLQIMTKENAILEELTDLLQKVETHARLLFYPDVNMGFMKHLKNLLINPGKKIVQITIYILRALFKATTRVLGKEVFGIFYEELIVKLKSKSKEDHPIIEALLYLSSNVALPSFLRRVEKGFQEKSSNLRYNLITLVNNLLTNKQNYDSTEAKSAANALLAIVRLAENELSKDSNPGVRKYAEQMATIIDSKFRDELSSVQQESVQDRTSNDAVGRRSAGFGSRKTQVPVSSEKAPADRPSERPASRTFGNGSVLESIMNFGRPGGLTPKPTQLTILPMNPTVKLSNLRDMKKESNLVRQEHQVSSLKEQSGRLSFKSSGNLLDASRSVKPATLYDIESIQGFEQAILALEKQPFDRKDQLNKTKLAEVFHGLIAKAASPPDVDRIAHQLARVKDDIDAHNLVSVLFNMHQTHNYFPSTLLSDFLPSVFKAPESHTRPSVSPVFKSMVMPAGSGDSKDLGALIDSFVAYFGPFYFFTVFEETLYRKEFFGSKEAELLVTVFQSLLVKIPMELHPVYLVLSVLRGFIYFHSCQRVASMLAEVKYIMATCYGRHNFLYIKREFDMANIRAETVIEIAQWTTITEYKNQPAMKKLSETSFKDKIISQMKDLTLDVKAFLSSPSKNEPLAIKELLQQFTRNFVYQLEERENTQLLDFLAEKMLDSNMQVQKLAVQALILHVNSAWKVTFKFSQKFLSNMVAAFRHKNNEIRSLALRTSFYVAKNIDPKVFRLLQQGLSDPSDDVKCEVLEIVINLMETKAAFVRMFELQSGFHVLVSMITSKKQKVREESEKVLRLLLTHYERNDFNQYVNMYQGSIKKILEQSFAKILEGHRDLAQPAPEDLEGAPGRLHEARFVIKRVAEIGEEVAKCKDIKGMKRFAQKHLAPELCAGLVDDVNVKKVLESVALLSEGLSQNQVLAVRSFVFVVKLLNLLIEAETKRNEISRAMFQVVASQIKMRKNSHLVLAKEEKWVLVEFLRTVYFVKFEPKEIQSAIKLVLGLFPDPAQKAELAKRIQQCDQKLFQLYFSNMREFSAASGTGGSQRKGSSNAPREASKRAGAEEDLDDFAGQEALDDEYDAQFLSLRDAMADQSSIKYETDSARRGDSPSPREGAQWAPSGDASNLRKRRASFSSNAEEIEGLIIPKKEDFLGDEFYSQQTPAFEPLAGSEPRPQKPLLEKKASAKSLAPGTKPPTAKPRAVVPLSMRPGGTQQIPAAFEVSQPKKSPGLRRDQSGDIKTISTGDQKRAVQAETAPPRTRFDSQQDISIAKTSSLC